MEQGLPHKALSNFASGCQPELQILEHLYFRDKLLQQSFKDQIMMLLTENRKSRNDEATVARFWRLRPNRQVPRFSAHLVDYTSLR